MGFVQKHDKTTVFAFNIKGEGASGAEAKKIALEYLKTRINIKFEDIKSE